MKNQLIILALITAFVACGEKPKVASAKQPSWVTAGALNSNVSKEDAKRIYQANLKQKNKKGSAFRSDEIAGADNKMLGFIAGGNFAELSIGLLIQNKDLINNAAKGMIELGKRSGNVGSYAWVNDLASTIDKMDSGAITLEQGSGEIDSIAQKFIQAANQGNSDFAVQVIAGYKFFYAGLLMGIGKESPTYSPFLNEYLVLYEKNLDAESVANLRKVQELASSAKTAEELNTAGNLLLKTIANLKLG